MNLDKRDIDKTEDTDEQEKLYYCYSATLRIYGSDLDLELISDRLKIQPSHSHKKGDFRTARGKAVGEPLKDDVWLFKAPVHEESVLDEHIQSLWKTFKPHKEYLLELKKKYEVDIFCGYRSNCDHAGFEVLPESLEIFIELKIPFGVSVIIC